MTKDNIGSLVGDLVAMARAYEELPQVQEALAKAHEDVETYARSLASRESHIIDLKAQIEAHLATIRKTEAERDDAELRFLKLDEKASKALGWLDDMRSSEVAIRGLLSPPPVVQPEAMVEALTVPTPTVPDAVHSLELHGNAGNVNSVSSGQGESNPQPSVESSSTDPLGDSFSQSSVSVNPEDGGPSTSPPTSAPSAPTGTGTENEASDFSTRFVGKKYIDVKGYYTLAEWLAGGGTSESYNDIDF